MHYAIYKAHGRHTAYRGKEEVIEIREFDTDQDASEYIASLWPDTDSFPYFDIEDPEYMKSRKPGTPIAIRNTAGEVIWQLGDNTIGDGDVFYKFMDITVELLENEGSLIESNKDDTCQLYAFCGKEFVVKADNNRTVITRDEDNNEDSPIFPYNHKTVLKSIRIPFELIKLLEEKASNEKRSFSNLVNAILWDAVE